MNRIRYINASEFYNISYFALELFFDFKISLNVSFSSYTCPSHKKKVIARLKILTCVECLRGFYRVFVHLLSFSTVGYD